MVRAIFSVLALWADVANMLGNMTLKMLFSIIYTHMRVLELLLLFQNKVYFYFYYFIYLFN